ncbi:MAG TPA: alpha/beta hydrolase [Mycobacteriales bacterium]|jgi:pimeloyl-ACP methyl ester carboxylesterase|nr:alpha/beta hydrolase [Mycobacteriales bacterium]
MSVRSEERPMPELPGVTHRQVDAGGVGLHVAEIGSGAPVVLLHGFPQHWFAWRDVAARLAPDHRVLSVDLRGFGWSDKPRTGYTTADRVTDLIALLDALELDRVDLVGHEWGAWAGFFACLRAPERFGHFLALNIVHPWPEHRHLAPSSWRFWYTTVLEAPGLGRLAQRHWPAYTRFLLRRGLGDRAAMREPVLEEYVAAGRVPGAARAGEALHRLFTVRDIPALMLNRNAKQHLTVPTLLLGGDRDPVFPPAVLGGGQGHADDLRVEILPGAGHWLPEERPNEVAAAARALFAR